MVQGPVSEARNLSASFWQYEYHNIYSYYHQTLLSLFICSHLSFGLKHKPEGNTTFIY